MKKIGVIVGRFQVDSLTSVHKLLIRKAIYDSDEVLILIGTSIVKIETANPLSYEIRKSMIRHEFPTVFILPIQDIGNLKYWNKKLDKILDQFSYNSEITIYGGRDSIIDTYTGKYKTKKIDEVIDVSGTKIRESVSRNIKDSQDFRRGIIYAAYERYKVGYSVVDVICKDKFDNILMGKKPNRDHICLIGGFYDPEKDKSLEDAAIRELNEETGIIGVNPKYLMSTQINDYRYRKESNKIVSSVFVLEYDSGNAAPDDDIKEVNWYNIPNIIEDGKLDEFYDTIVDSHKEIVKNFIKVYYEKN